MTTKARTRGNEKTNNALELPDSVRARVRIENVRPSVDFGRHPIKRVIGEPVVVEADVFADGHDRLGVELLHRQVGADEWLALPMEDLGNDLWRASFTVLELGRHEYLVQGFIDRFESLRTELEKKHAAGQDVEMELVEGASMVREAAARASTASTEERNWLRDQSRILAGSSTSEVETRVAVALEERLRLSMSKHAERTDVVRSEPVLPVVVDRERARYGAWYEMFPRSAGSDPGRGATFGEAEARLSSIASMGFDVLYLPPIHPIGKTHRKGPNNTLRAGPEDPGSPWAIGGEEGGHDAVHPGLGTVRDFERFVASAEERGLEVALDLAFQCSPDHPYVKEHPEWFRFRPDGSIKYAENPPKKYQDIVPFDFECEDWRNLWRELLRVVRVWIDRGVRIFRVDNPHTKPFRFWEWLIAEVQRERPDVLFLAEAFTRPKVLKHLAKCGFSQSYTYFTWRNTKQELQTYLKELTQGPTAEYLRPNFFVNTPDILHEYLQFGGRAAFQIRLALAATLGASYGIYGPAFELCESSGVPGTEEYQDSEKYQVRLWDRDRPGNIRSFITRVNRIRRECPALHDNRNLRFHEIDNERMVFFSKTTADLENIILVVVNLDPHNTQSGWLQVPRSELGIEDEVTTYQVHDLLSDSRFLWHGERNYVSLDPRQSPAHVFRLRRRIKTERDFDYFL